MEVHKTVLVGQWGVHTPLRVCTTVALLLIGKNRRKHNFLGKKTFFFSFELNAFIFSCSTLQRSEQCCVFLFAIQSQLPAEQLEAFSSPQPGSSLSLPDHGAAELP